MSLSIYHAASLKRRRLIYVD